MTDRGPRIVSTYRMESILRHNVIEWIAHCYVSTNTILGLGQKHHEDIKSVLDKLKGIF